MLGDFLGAKMGIYPKALNTRSLKSYVGFHTNQQTLTLIPWGCAEVKNPKKPPSSTGLRLGAGRDEEVEGRGSEKKARVPTRRGRSGDDWPSTISIQKQIGIVGISLGAPDGNGRPPPGVA